MSAHSIFRIQNSTMKSSFLLSFLLLSTFVFGQDDNRTTDIGTSFNYKVTEGKLSYKLTVTIKKWDWESIKFQWQTSKPKPGKGTVTMSFGAIGDGTDIKIKPKTGILVLPGNVCSFVLPYNVFDSLFNMQYATTVSIDGRKEILDPVKTIEDYPLKYNKGVQKVLYGEGYNDKEGKEKLKLGFIEYMNDIIIVAKYVNGNFSMELESVSSPAQSKGGK